jgi:hypothetical protein
MSSKGLSGATTVTTPKVVIERTYLAPPEEYFMLHGIVQHELYQAGEIALPKKALA